MIRSQLLPNNIPRPRLNKVIISGLRSDSHTWGLAYLQLWMEERDVNVCNLGSCVPLHEFLARCREEKPALVMISSVNGHGAIEAIALAQEFQLVGLIEHSRLVIGGQLTTSVEREDQVRQKLLEAGYSGIFTGQNAMCDFHAFLHAHWDIPTTVKTAAQDPGAVRNGGHRGTAHLQF